MIPEAESDAFQAFISEDFDGSQVMSVFSPHRVNFCFCKLPSWKPASKRISEMY